MVAWLTGAPCEAPSRTATSTASSGIIGRDYRGKMNNWAGNIAFGAQEIEAAASAGAASACVKAHERMKVLGTRHSFNGIADSTDRFVTVSALDDVSIDVEAKTV